MHDILCIETFKASESAVDFLSPSVSLLQKYIRCKSVIAFYAIVIIARNFSLLQTDTSWNT